jgi:riboflavin biosynthesis pyrimidine reductase
MRLLLDETGTHAPGEDLDEAALADVYAPPEGPWLRVNFVSTLDGAATGTDGRSGSINTAADGVVFRLLRRLSDVVVVGAGTARTEGYTRLGADDGGPLPLAVVSNSARVPEALVASAADRGRALLVTHAGAPQEAVDGARRALGEDAVLVCGETTVDLVALRRELEARGLRRILAEGGPSLLGTMFAAGVVDELDLTWSPTVAGGTARRIVAGPPLDVSLAPIAMVEGEGSVMGRWRVRREVPAPSS